MSALYLKIIAMVTMLIDHCGDVFFPRLYFMRVIGRVAMPLYSLMLADSCRHLKDQPDRMRRFLAFLAVSALISEPFYDECFFGGFPSPESHNQVLQFLSFAAAYALCAWIDRRFARAEAAADESGAGSVEELTPRASAEAAAPGTQARTAASARFLVWAAVTALNWYFRPGYAAAGILLPLAYLRYLDRLGDMSRGERLRVNALLMLGFIYCQAAEQFTEYLGARGLIYATAAVAIPGLNWGVFLAVPLLAAYDGSYGRVSKLFKRAYRAFYPLHLAAIYLLMKAL